MIQDFFISQYNKVISKNNCFLTKAVRVLLKDFASVILPITFYWNKKKYCIKGTQNGIIISLTTFPARVEKLWLVLETLLRQTFPADKIIVWLSEEQIPSVASLPKRIRSYKKRGVEFRIVEGDIRSYKKFYYSFKEFPDSLVITVDDDIFYDSHLVQELVNKYYSTTGKRVIARYGTIVTRDNKGKLIKYNEWKKISSILLDEDYFFGSGGGTLFHPRDLYKDVCRLDLFMALCPNADDIWLNAMCRLGGVKVLMSNNLAVFPVPLKNNIELCAQNVIESLNDRQISSINEYYNRLLNITVF